jgi:hypothetical protein
MDPPPNCLDTAGAVLFTTSFPALIDDAMPTGFSFRVEPYGRSTPGRPAWYVPPGLRQAV